MKVKELKIIIDIMKLLKFCKEYKNLETNLRKIMRIMELIEIMKIRKFYEPWKENILILIFSLFLPCLIFFFAIN